jgi:hypothetical protein
MNLRSKELASRNVNAYTVSLRSHCRYGTADIWYVHTINLFSPGLFNDAFNISDYTASSDRTINEQWTGKGVEGSNTLIWRTIMAFALGTEINQEKSQPGERDVS